MTGRRGKTNKDGDKLPEIMLELYLTTRGRAVVNISILVGSIVGGDQYQDRGGSKNHETGWKERRKKERRFRRTRNNNTREGGKGKIEKIAKEYILAL